MYKETRAPPPSELTGTASFSDSNDDDDDDDREGESQEEFYGEEIWTTKEESMEEEEEELPQEEELMDEDFYYRPTEEYISKAWITPDCTLPENILQFDYSYGYDCLKLFNLCVVNQTILIYGSGSIIHFFDTTTGTKTYRRSCEGGGIGHITVSPVNPHIAVGEKGQNPPILIYHWPSMEVLSFLRGGSKKSYVFLDYSPDGELLCSQGGYPDYMITIWNWRKRRIMLRSKAHGQPVFNSRFSFYSPNQLTSSGIGHIKFWKINKTFTGLKLLGELGRFGKSEICNIVGFMALPDEKVVSGCEWGNILLWDGGLIKLEVCRRGRVTCHDAPITQFIYNNGDLTTVAMDGTIKVWYYETIELADPSDEDRFIEVEPIFEYEVGDYYHKAELLLIVKADPDNVNDFKWFGQDGNGGIWSLALNMTSSLDPPSLIFLCHSGPVAAVQCCPCSTHLASLGEDGKLMIYDYKKKVLVFKKEFMVGGCSLLWLPLSVEESGSVMIGGFTDGVIRVICVSLKEYEKKMPSPTDDYINLIFTAKPHTRPVTVITVNPRNNILVTGSDDATIFIYQIREGIQYPKFVPIGFVHVTGEVTHCTWKPKKEATILVSCKNGTFTEIDLPLEPLDSEPVSYSLIHLPSQKKSFVSIKSEIQRAQKMAEIEEQKQAYMRAVKEELQAKESEGELRDESVILQELEEELDRSAPDLPELYIPEIPSPVLFATYVDKSVWVSMGGFDAGYIYEYNFMAKGPLRYKVIPNAEDVEISCYEYYHNHKYLVLGMSDGSIRIIRGTGVDSMDIANYWSLSMHDNENGIVRQICFDYTYSYMFTCGNDGNVFAYKFQPENDEYKTVQYDLTISKGFPTEVSPDIDDKEAPSLEQAKNKIENEEKLKAANVYKRDLVEVLKGLEKKFESLLKQNAKLPKSQQLTPEELILDMRIVEDLQKYLERELEMVKFKNAWFWEKSRIQFEKLQNYFIKPVAMQIINVQGIINKELFAQSFRLKNLGSQFTALKELVQNKIEEQEAKGRAQARIFSEEDIVETIVRRPNPVEGLLKQIMVLCGDYKKNIKLRRLLRKYRDRKDKLESRRIEWYEMMKTKPNPDKPDPEDVTSIENAKSTIGNYQLKTAPDYKVSKTERITTVQMYDQLLKTREEIYLKRKNYNEKIIAMRTRKMEMIERHEFLRETLLEIAKEIPKEKIKHPPPLPTYDEELEFPDKKFLFTESGVYEELPKRYKNLFMPEKIKKKELKLLDKEYEMLLTEKKGPKVVKTPTRLALMKFSGITGSKDIGELEAAGKDDQILTPWEKECKKLRVIKRLYEQDKIIEEMDTGIHQFDVDLLNLHHQRYQLEVDLKLLDLHLLTLYQEVIILKRFEAVEEDKETKLSDKLHEKRDIQKRMNDINSKVEARNREIRRCEEEIKTLVTLFHAATEENKFYDFLRRIFKKKYRPPKVKSEDSDSDSSTESSSSSEEEDIKSLDSKDIGTLRLDETICPPGCDVQLFEYTFTQRSARHALELTVMEEKKQIELQKKEIESLVKKIKLVEGQYQACEEDLEAFLREKQRNLNEVETVVVLHLNQLQNFKSDSEFEKISDSVLFSSAGLTNLYKRVGELEKETKIEKQKHEKNRQHLTRIKIDVKHMKELIVKLNKDIEEAMIKKLGVKVDLDEMEECLLKRIVAEMHSIVLELSQDLDKQLSSIKQKLTLRENQFAMKLQDNTERFNLIAVLQEEKLRIKEKVERQTAAMCLTKPNENEAKKDIENLQNIIKSQEEKIAELRKEISMLKLKEMPLPQPPPQYQTDENEPEITTKLIIKSCDGELEEISMSARDELREICDEAQEIAEDAKRGHVTDEDLERMKELTSEMIDKLPNKCREGLLRRLSERKLKEPESEVCAKGIVMDIIKTLRTESFLEALEVVKGAIEDIIPQFNPDDCVY